MNPEKEKISAFQAFMLIHVSAISNIFIFMVTPAVKSSGRDAWITIFISYTAAALIGLLYVKLAERFPNRTIIQYLPDLMGTFFGKLLGLFIILHSWIFSGIIFRETTIPTIAYMEHTPVIILIVLMAIMLLYIVKQGIEVFARVSEIFIPFMVLSILFIVISHINNLEWKQLLPVTKDGVSPIFQGSIRQMAFSLETVFFLSFWYPCLKRKDKAVKVVFFGLVIIGVLLSFMTAGIIALSGEDYAVHLANPIIYMARAIWIAEFLTGIESLLIPLWFLGGLFKLFVFFYPSVVGMAQLFGLRDYRPLIVPMALVSIVVSMVPNNRIDTLKLDDMFDVYFILPLTLLIPVLLLIAKIRNITPDKTN